MTFHPPRRRLATRLAILPPLIWLACCGGESPEPPVQGPSLALAEASYDFGSVPQGTRVEHAFPVSNNGTEELVIKSVQAPDLFDRTDHPASLAPGEKGEIVLGFDTKGLAGTGAFQIKIDTNEPEGARHTISLSGSIVPLIEIRPHNRVYFLNLPRGAGAEKDLAVVNHQDRPLKIEEVAAQPGGSFSAELETVRQGFEYRLRIKLDPDAPAGRFEETIELKTDSPDLPRIPIFARAWIVDEVSADPDAVRFSQVRLTDLASQDALAVKRVRVAKRDATDFRVLDASTDIPFISVRVETEAEGRSYMVSVRVDPSAAEKGELKGTLTIRTNDEKFPQLNIPISGHFL